MGEKSSLFCNEVDWLIWLVYGSWLGTIYEHLTETGCVTGDMNQEAQKKIAQATLLLTEAVKDHKLEKCELGIEILHDLIKRLNDALNECFSK